MGTANDNFTVTSAFYPDWWNVNTHRCNHINRTPLFQANYGLGRALFADWGRVGAVKVQTEPDSVKVIPQISVELSRKLRCSELPVPLFSPFYACSVLPYIRTTVQTSLTDTGEEGTECDTSDAFFDNDFTSDHLLSDPIAGDQAAAALLFARIYSGLRRNRALLNTSTSSPDASSVHRLDELERLADDGHACCSAAEQDRVLQQIRKLFNPGKPSGPNKNFDGTIDLSDDETVDEMVSSPDRHSNLPKRPRYTPKPSRATKPQSLPPFIENLFNISSTKSTEPFRQSYWLAGLDPALIRLAGRTVNPVFQGNGLLCSIKNPDLGTVSATCHAPVLLWSPPKPVDSLDAPNALFISNWSPSAQWEASETCYLTLPSNLLPNSRLCEVDAAFTSQSSMNVVTRWTDGSALDNVAVFQLTATDPNSLLSYSVSNTFQPKLPDRANTVCLNPWLTEEWAVAGTHVDASGDRIAFTRLYSTDSSGTVCDPIWSGRVVLDEPCETFHGIREACCEASELIDSSSKVQKGLLDISSDPRFSVLTDSGFGYAPFTPWIRIGFGQDPSQLCLTTSRRMLLMDTRQASVAQLLFRFPTDAPGNTLFNVTDHFTAAPPRFLSDVYVLAGTAYNLLVLDKRMPLRPVLHSAHSLFGAPTYLDWTMTSCEIRNQYDLPQFLVTMCAQNPPGVACVGLNLGSPVGPQLVGPSCSGEPLTRILTGAESDLPTQLLASKAVMRRLQSTYCGLTSTVSQTESGQDALCALTLTGTGDVFMHSWHFNPTNETEAIHQENSKRCRNWLSELRCNLMTDTEHVDQSNESNEFEIDLTEINRLTEDLEPSTVSPTQSDQHCRYWSFANLAPLEDFQPNSTVVHSSRWLVRDLWSAWTGRMNGSEQFSGHALLMDKDRLAEERMRRTQLDSCTEAAKNRIRRFQHILYRMTGDSSGFKDDSPYYQWQ